MKKNVKTDSPNDIKLLEFIKSLSIVEWKRIKALASIKYVIYLRGEGGNMLEKLIKNHGKLKRKPLLNLDIFNTITKGNFKNADWKYFTSETLSLCSFHVRSKMLNRDTDMILDLEEQVFYMLNNMRLNHEHKLNQNKRKINEQYVAEKSFQGFMMAYQGEIGHSNLKNKENRTQLNDFSDWIIGNELYYYENKLRIICALKQRASYQKVTNHNLSLLPEDIPESIRHFPQIQLYTQVLELKLNPTEVHFQHLLKTANHFLQQPDESHLTPKYLEPIYYHLLNYCVDRIKLNDERHLQLYVDLNQQILQHGLLLEQGKISGGNYKNICKAYTLLGQLEELEEFMDAYEDKLVNGLKNPFAIYSRAQYYYVKDDFDSCILYALKSDNLFEYDAYVKMDTKQLLILSYLQNNDPKCDKEIRNLILMLKRKKDQLSDEFVSLWKNTLDYLQRISNVPPLVHVIQEECTKILEAIQVDAMVKNKYLIVQFLEKKLGAP